VLLLKYNGTPICVNKTNMEKIMKVEDFIEDLKEILEIEEELLLTTDLTEIKEFDSLARMSLIALIDEKFENQFSSDELDSITSVDSLIQLIGTDNFK